MRTARTGLFQFIHNEFRIFSMKIISEIPKPITVKLFIGFGRCNSKTRDH
jgi:hypothetical protein